MIDPASRANLIPAKRGEVRNAAGTNGYYRRKLAQVVLDPGASLRQAYGETGSSHERMHGNVMGLCPSVYLGIPFSNRAEGPGCERVKGPRFKLRRSANINRIYLG